MLILIFSCWKVRSCFSVPFSLLEGWHLCNSKAYLLLYNGWRSGSWFFEHTEKQTFIQPTGTTLCRHRTWPTAAVSQINSCAEKGVMSQLQLWHVLLTNILHVESQWFCYWDIICGKSKIQRKCSHVGFVDDGKGTMGKPDRDKYLLLLFSSAHFCSGMKQGLKKSRNYE